MIQSDDAAYAAKQGGKLPGDFVAYANAQSVKSWFMLDDEIVVLAAGISDAHDRDAITTIDSRIAAPSDALSVTGALRDGSPVSGSGSAAGLHWLQYSNTTRGFDVGYVFFDENTVDVRLREVQRNLRLVRASNPNTVVAKNVFDLAVSHPAGAPAASIAYAIVPGADAAALQRYDGSKTGPVVLENSNSAQAIRHSQLGILAANVFAETAQEIGTLSIDGPASLIAQNADRGRTVVAVSDPTFARDQVSVTVRGRRAILGSPSGVTAQAVRGGTRLVFDTHHAYGATVSVTVRGHGIV